jgi:hypothetical protein
MEAQPEVAPEPMSVDLSCLGSLPCSPEDESSAAIDLAAKKAGAGKLLGWALQRIAGGEPLDTVEAAIEGEQKHRESLAACADAAHRALGEAILAEDSTRSARKAPAANDDMASLDPRARSLKQDLESRLENIDADLREVENASGHEDDGTNAVLAAMDERSVELIRKRMLYAGRGSVRAMVKIRRETLLEERAKIEARLSRLLDRAKRSPAETSFPALAAKKRGGVPPEPLEVGRTMASQAERFKGGEVVERRLCSVKRLLEDSAQRTRLLEEARKRLKAEAKAEAAPVKAG